MNQAAPIFGCPNPHDAETSPLLVPPSEQAAAWRPPRGFLWIQLAIMTNVFLYAFDSTIMASTYAVISSEFDAANTASWLTTSYLITSTSFQPLYGRVSDIFGRRVCFFISTVTFGLGCLGCGLAGDIFVLNCMRALAGFGGGGLMTMATIINSDMIPFRRRGMYQALQNGIFGFGAICGASFGGSIADHIGWRWCFLLQLPFSLLALLVGILAVPNQPSATSGGAGFSLDEGLDVLWRRVDFLGALLLVFAVSTQLLGLSMGGNELPWDSPLVTGSLLGSVVLFAVFLYVEATTTSIPVIPLRLLKGRLPVATQIANLFAGMAAYAVILLDSATTAGARLAIPSLAAPIGGLIAGVVMSRWGLLIPLIRFGAIFMTIGNALVLSLAFQDSAWKYVVYIFPASLGTGTIYPSILFTSLASFEHADHAVSASTVYLIRSLGSVWGVSISSAVMQNVLAARLPEALSNLPNKWEIIEEIRHSTEALRHLPPDVQLKARLVFYEALRYAFSASTIVGMLAVLASFVASPSKLRSTHS
ncbi:major facilitator superfamily domain-containing protein [Stachybotrys elegans]|uniref:Major facilitator superfamily domain-containing protein n=1 Tax=Stachybotrys elegans TaxID=80388 RepID=A0A8K0SJ96_9HYPO|nr:major facilitator superfamily domain-containing protein [Stachybotrys elegans]